MVDCTVKLVVSEKSAPSIVLVLACRLLFYTFPRNLIVLNVELNSIIKFLSEFNAVIYAIQKYLCLCFWLSFTHRQIQPLFLAILHQIQ